MEDFMNPTQIKTKHKHYTNYTYPYALQEYSDFKKYEKAVINFFSNIPDDYKTEFAQKLIMKLIHPLNSYQIEDILETSSSLKST